MSVFKYNDLEIMKLYFAMHFSLNTCCIVKTKAHTRLGY